VPEIPAYPAIPYSAFSAAEEKLTRPPIIKIVATYQKVFHRILANDPK